MEAVLIQLDAAHPIPDSNRDEILRLLVRDVSHAVVSRPCEEGGQLSWQLLLKNTSPPSTADLNQALRQSFPTLDLTCHVTVVDLVDTFIFQGVTPHDWPPYKLVSDRAAEKLTFYFPVDITPKRQALFREVVGFMFVDDDEESILNYVRWVGGWSQATHLHAGRETKIFHLWVDWMSDEYEKACKVDEKADAHAKTQWAANGEFVEKLPDDAPFWAPLEHFATCGYETERVKWEKVVLLDE